MKQVTIEKPSMVSTLLPLFGCLSQAAARWPSAKVIIQVWAVEKSKMDVSFGSVKLLFCRYTAQILIIICNKNSSFF